MGFPFGLLMVADDIGQLVVTKEFFFFFVLFLFLFFFLSACDVIWLIVDWFWFLGWVVVRQTINLAPVE